MKIKAFLFFLILTAAGAAQNQRAYLPLESSSTNYINDLVLIYQGGLHRMEWNEDQLAPYTAVYDSAAGKGSWLFDGFLFIEFKDGRGFEYAHGYGNKPARKEEWLWLLNRNFEKGKAIDALDNVISEFKTKLGNPPSKRRVVLTLPEPVRDQTGWGEVNGQQLDFRKTNDRILACRWYIYEAYKLWRKLNPENLELAGFYWVAEYGSEAAEVIPEAAAIIHRSGKRFYWIPYWNAPMNSDWKKLGFDAAYQQPNHFFNLEVENSRLDEAAKFAENHNMGLEMEFDKRMITDSVNFYNRFWSYINAFENNEVWKSSAVAYYEGGGALYELAVSKNPALNAAYRKLTEIIIMRQKK